MINIRKNLDAYLRLMRLDKPIGIFLLLWPTLWALWIASNGIPNSKLLCIFILGTVLMRSAGCVLNDIADRKFDGSVLRTKHRPLVTGELKVKQAYALSIVLSLIAFLLVLQLNTTAILLSIPALGLAVSYPYFKRFFPFPQAYLGIAFGFGIPMAFAAVNAQVPNIAWLMLLANICWALAYDSAYAMVDKPYDLKIGIHSSAISFGRHEVAMIMLCYALFLSLMLWLGCLLQMHAIYFIALILAAGLSIYHYSLIRTRQPDLCFKAFLHNNWLGLIIFVGIVLNYR